MSFVIRLNDDELEALDALPSSTRVLYMLGLRPFMDYSNGIVGLRRRVCLQGFRELLEYEPERGSRLGGRSMPSKDAVRNEVERLVRAGLVVRLPKRRRSDPLVFKLPLANRDAEFRPQEEPHMNPIPSTPVGTTKADAQQAPSNQDVACDSGGINNTSNHIAAPQEEPHTSVLPLKNTTSTTGARVVDFQRRAAVVKNPVDEWELSDEARGMLAAHGVLLAFLEEVLTEYRLYWAARGDTRVSWDSHFVSHCLWQWRRNGHEWLAHGKQVRRDGFIEKHTDRSWADGLGGDE